MKLKLQFILAIIFLSSVGLQAQRNYYPGYVVTLDKDTVRGMVQYINPVANELSIKFISDETGKKVKFTASDLVSYAFRASTNKSKANKWLYYERHRLEKSFKGEDAGSRDVFLRVEIKGTLSLYHYYTLGNNNDNIPFEHNYYVTKGGVNGHYLTRVTRENYKAVATDIAGTNPDLYQKIGTSGFGYKHLSKIVAIQNARLNGEDLSPKQKTYLSAID